MSKTKYRKSMEKFQKILIPTIYGDVPTFLGAPAVKEKGELKGTDAAFLGLPSQGAEMLVGREVGINMLDTVRLRKASIKYGGYLPELDIDVLDRINLVDCGDVTGFYPSCQEKISDYFKLAAKKISEILEARCIPLTIGAHPYLVAKSICGMGGKLGIIHLDAHADNMEVHEGDRWSLACWVTRVSEIAGMNMKNFVQIGMRGPRNFKEQMKWYRQKGATVYTSAEIERRGIEEIAEEAITKAKTDTDHLFLNLDLDVLDLGAAPGLDEPLGITTSELLKIAYRVGKNMVTAFNVEWIPTPAWQPYQLPAWPLYWITTWTILYLLAGVASSKRLPR
ncbi:MAG: arginase family protein [Candidatus Hadarchaeum sp.]|uniref:arginase family protein n=1 Tax=Candidatus Hadarchaeum sp. TaxID=2883567 RepID=UPI003D0C22B4